MAKKVSKRTRVSSRKMQAGFSDLSQRLDSLTNVISMLVEKIAQNEGSRDTQKHQRLDSGNSSSILIQSPPQKTLQTLGSSEAMTESPKSRRKVPYNRRETSVEVEYSPSGDSDTPKSSEKQSPYRESRGKEPGRDYSIGQIHQESLIPLLHYSSPVPALEIPKKSAIGNKALTSSVSRYPLPKPVQCLRGPNFNFEKKGYVLEYRGENRSLYTPEYALVEVKGPRPAGNRTRLGLCPYCDMINFICVTDGSYSIHLAGKHGILHDGNVIPDPLIDSEKMRPEGPSVLICPICTENITCIKSTYYYLMHFRSTHNVRKRLPEKIDK